MNHSSRDNRQHDKMIDAYNCANELRIIILSNETSFQKWRAIHALVHMCQSSALLCNEPTRAALPTTQKMVAI